MISSTVGVATRSAYQPSKYSADRGFRGIGPKITETESAARSRARAIRFVGGRCHTPYVDTYFDEDAESPAAPATGGHSRVPVPDRADRHIPGPLAGGQPDRQAAVRRVRSVHSQPVAGLRRGLGRLGARPVDNRLDAEDRATLVAKSSGGRGPAGRTGMLRRRHRRRRASPALPGQAHPGRPEDLPPATKAATTRDTVPWSFYVAGPDGAMPLLTRADRERYGLVRLSPPASRRPVPRGSAR
jgi:hypothetical protein